MNKIIKILKAVASLALCIAMMQLIVPGERAAVCKTHKPGESFLGDDGIIYTPCTVCGSILTDEDDGSLCQAGDADGDFLVTASDARIALRMSVGLEKSDFSLDVNGDGQISGDDARLILRVSVGLETLNGHIHYGKILSAEPTCTVKGGKYIVCDCGASLTVADIDPLGHNFVKQVCTRCGAVDTAHVHKYTKKVVEPTCKAKGYTLYTCDCGDSYKADYTPAAHKAVNGVCVYCNQKISSTGYVITTKNGVTYVGGVLVVNKTYKLPSSYNPGGLTSECSVAFAKLQAAAKKAGYTYTINSGFRTYSEQKTLYNNYVKQHGSAEAKKYCAVAGASEHQTGLAIDVGVTKWSDYEWLAANAYKYGFIIRYTADKTAITGYSAEEWHIRYLGTDLAKKVYKSGLCLEEYLGIS